MVIGRGRRMAAGLVALALVSILAACSEEDSPPADYTIRIETARFFPNTLEVPAGASVRWVNVLSRTSGNERTVTSGTGPDDAEAGIAFDDTLLGYTAGNAEGESVIHRFDEPGTVSYFTRIPSEIEYGGTVTVR